MHELLLSCSLDYSLAVLMPEAGLTDLDLPDRQALCAACPRSARPAMRPMNHARVAIAQGGVAGA